MSSGPGTGRPARRCCCPAPDAWFVWHTDLVQVVQGFEATRRRCCRLQQDAQRAREQLSRVEAERAVLEVKLKHARNQVEVEMKKRHRAEAELEKQV